VNAAERVEEVLARHGRALSFDQAILIAASEAEGKPLDPRRLGDAAVVLCAEGLLQRGRTVRKAIAEARTEAKAAAADQPKPARSGTDGTSRVLLEQHDVGPHAAELREPPTDSRKLAPTSPTPWGELIGTCPGCGRGIGDQDPAFASWAGSHWRFIGYPPSRARRFAAARPLLCWSCSVRLECRLIPPPDPHPRAGCHV
jgi:hypothetical protein